MYRIIAVYLKRVIEKYLLINIQFNLQINYQKCYNKFYVRFYTFSKHFNMLSNSQFGFRTKLNTTHDIFNLQTQICNSYRNNKIGAAIFIDLKNSFDTVNHYILFSKLENIVIRGISLNWIKSYFTKILLTLKTIYLINLELKLVFHKKQF